MAMKVVEVNVGEKIPYTVSKTKVTFDDELMAQSLQIGERFRCQRRHLHRQVRDARDRPWCEVCSTD